MFIVHADAWSLVDNNKLRMCRQQRKTLIVDVSHSKSDKKVETKRARPKSRSCNLAEGVGFEPTDGRPSTVFKTVALSRSATPPNGENSTKGFCSCKHLI